MRPILLALAACALTVSTASAQEFETPAEYAVIMDSETGTILYSKNGDKPMHPASMTKIMTAELVFERIKSGDLSMDETFTVSENAWRKGGAASGSSTMFLQPNSQVAVDDLLHGMIVQSGNDACIVLAEGLEGSEDAFAQVMTERAHEMGLDSASFLNSTGWPEENHLISANDLAQLANHQIKSYPELYDIYAIPEFTYNGIRQYNRNPLLGSFEGVDGLKTGHTEASGYGLVASAERDGERRIIVLNGLDSNSARAQEAERMMRAAFVDFNIYDLFAADEKVGEGEVFMGQQGSVALKPQKDIKIGMHRRAREDMKVSIVYDGAIRAPIAEGDPVARLEVTAPGHKTRTYPLVAAETVPRKGMIGRAAEALFALISGNA